MRRENKNVGSTNVYRTNYWAGDCVETMGKSTTEMGIAEP